MISLYKGVCCDFYPEEKCRHIQTHSGNQKINMKPYTCAVIHLHVLIRAPAHGEVPEFLHCNCAAEGVVTRSQPFLK